MTDAIFHSFSVLDVKFYRVFIKLVPYLHKARLLPFASDGHF